MEASTCYAFCKSQWHHRKSQQRHSNVVARDQTALEEFGSSLHGQECRKFISARSFLLKELTDTFRNI